MDLFEKCRSYHQADELKEKNIYPYFHRLESRQNTEVTMEGERRIMLGSNNYLGLTADEEIIHASIEALKKYGTGCSGSRFLNGTLDMHLELEKELADFLQQEDCVTFGPGFESNLECGCLIITDGVFSMSGDIAKLPEITALAEKYGARVMVDDAHGLGVIGEGGRGTASYFGLEDKVDIYMGTFSKSLASLGGFMAGRHYVADYIRHNSRPFIFSASIPPANCAAALASLRRLRAHPELPEHLRELAGYAREGFTARGVKIRKSDAGVPTPIIPLYTGTVENTLRKDKALFQAGVYVNPVLPPATPASECLLRTSYMATHTKPILDEAMDIIAKVLNSENN